MDLMSPLEMSSALIRLLEESDMSEFHFSRAFKGDWIHASQSLIH